ncbi:putative RNA-binding Zn ribbon-like protein [Micromonospora pisi]|uniref:Putative RNA-binding Zn ribbon-like protein n=1 Tax=Micromonospora pisi TaxID=589240 RepID=A0A495JQL4_9ACTN|nr:ABATE domain-containing protein [Micromonospora pisi]RKR91267.1 putative RNA-binding Zn ribbon-like protein [Micromonospora pisi]
MIAAATGLVLRTPDGTPYLFDPGTLCLDLLTAGGPGVLARYDVLHEPSDLANWLSLSRLRLDPADVRVTSDDVQTARRLRDALWQLTRACARGETRRAEDLDEVNRAALPAPLVPQITPTATRGWQLPADGAQALSTIARDAVELFTGPHADRIRECSAPDCYLIFVDVSRSLRRRWCAMEACGNRHKVRALRARRNANEAPMDTSPDSAR